MLKLRSKQALGSQGSNQDKKPFKFLTLLTRQRDRRERAVFPRRGIGHGSLRGSRLRRQERGFNCTPQTRKRAGDQERKRAGEQESKRVREQESKRAAEQESKRAREHESRSAGAQEGKKAWGRKPQIF